MKNQAYKLQEIVRENDEKEFKSKLEKKGFKISIAKNGVYGFRKGKR